MCVKTINNLLLKLLTETEELFVSQSICIIINTSLHIYAYGSFLLKMKRLRLIIYTFFGPFLLPPALIIFLILTIINEISRLIVKLLLHFGKEKGVSLVSDGADGIWGCKKPGSTRNVMVWVGAESGNLSRELLYRIFSEALASKDGSLRPYEKLERILVNRWGYVCWKSLADFDLWNHIRFLEDSENCPLEESDVLNKMSGLADDMGEDKPQWELILVQRVLGNF
jgi:hypothetical protein